MVLAALLSASRLPALLVAALVVLACPTVAKEPPQARADLERTMAYLAERAQEDGLGDLLPYFVEAAVAAGLAPDAWPPGQESVLSRLERFQPSSANMIYQLRPAHALAMAGAIDAQDARIQRLLGSHHDGQFGDVSRVNDDIWALIALSRAGVPKEDPRLQSSAQEILLYQDRTGGWSWQAGGSPETDMTGMALQALAAVGRLGEPVADKALGFIVDHTNEDGGVSIVKPAPANCDSTVWSIRGHLAAGYEAPAKGWAYLASLRNADGSYDFDAGLDLPHLLCTLEVATLLGEALQEGWNLPGYSPGTEPALIEAWAPLGALATAAWAMRRSQPVR